MQQMEKKPRGEDKGLQEKYQYNTNNYRMSVSRLKSQGPRLVTGYS